jgi:ABC-type multidrug transport system permease subunit
VIHEEDIRRQRLDAIERDWEARFKPGFLRKGGKLERRAWPRTSGWRDFLLMLYAVVPVSFSIFGLFAGFVLGLFSGWWYGVLAFLLSMAASFASWAVLGSFFPEIH